MKTLFYMYLSASLFLITSCRDNKPTPPEKIPDAEIMSYKAAIVKIYPYIVLEDSAYHLTLSKEEALKMQVAEKDYDRIVQDLEYTNYIVEEEYNKKGIPIEMPEPRLDSAFINEISNLPTN